MDKSGNGNHYYPWSNHIFFKRIQLHVMALYIYNNSVNHHFIVMEDFNYNPITHKYLTNLLCQITINHCIPNTTNSHYLYSNNTK